MLQITSFLFLISKFDEKNSSKNKAAREWAGQWLSPFWRS
jgi:hypothetical protein